MHPGGLAYVSLLVDYYGIKDSYSFPGWEESKGIASKEARWKFLCDRMSADIAPELAQRFIPYMQIHEFESLLFSDIDVFKNNFDNSELDFSVLEEAVQEFPNPEDINTRPTLAPSKRLIKAIPGYEKIIYGDCLASEIGLKKIREKCPLFNQWFSYLCMINSCKTEFVNPQCIDEAGSEKVADHFRALYSSECGAAGCVCRCLWNA